MKYLCSKYAFSFSVAGAVSRASALPLAAATPSLFKKTKDALFTALFG